MQPPCSPVVQKVGIVLAGLNHRRGLKNAYLVLIGRRYLSGIGAAVQGGYLDIAMVGARNDLDALEGACQDDHIAAGGVGLETEETGEY